MAIKQRILRIWDDAAPAVKLCCIKFAQRVVLAQTTAINMDKVRVPIGWHAVQKLNDTSL